MPTKVGYGADQTAENYEEIGRINPLQKES